MISPLINRRGLMRWLQILYTMMIVSLCADEKIGLIPSRPEQIAALTSESSSLVGGCVHPLSGSLSLRITDLVAKGAQSVELTRIYIPPAVVPPSAEQGELEQYYNEREYYAQLYRTYRGWVFVPHVQLESSFPKETKIPDKNGAIYTFSQNQLSFSYGVSNVSGDRPSGTFDPRNIRFTQEEKKMVVFLSDGTKRTYFSPYGTLFYLEKEILPNGKIVKYSYKDNFGHLEAIKSYDPQERFLYASIQFEGEMCRNESYYHDRTKKRKCGTYHFTEGESSTRTAGISYFAISKATTHTGQSAHFTYESKTVSRDLHKDCGKFHYEFSFPPFLKSASTPLFRLETLHYQNPFCLATYTGLDSIFHSTYKNSSYVETLSFPVGKNDAFIPVYKLNYQSPVAGNRGGITRVSHADGTATLYRYSKNFLLLSMQTTAKDETLKKEKVYSWDEKNWLRAIEWKDGQGKLFYQKIFEDYDSYGNPRKEIFSGDLTGSGNVDSYTTRRTFSADHWNLLLSEENDDGLLIVYEYLLGTNLLQTKWTQHKGKTLLREQWKYDDCNNLTKKIVDDGSETPSECHITTYILRQQPPFLHMPEWVEESYLEQGNIRLLKKRKLSYDNYGNINKEEHFGSDGKWVYTIEREWDEQGNLLSETNPLGYRVRYAYDPRGYRKEAHNFSARLEIKQDYDATGRLKLITETGDQKLVHRTIFDYDPLDRLEKKIDLFDNVTTYTNDPISGKPTLTRLPPVMSLSQQPTPVSKTATYDALGRTLTETDARGNTTQYWYNAYGSPSKILYANGASETFRYYKNSKLHLQTDREGLVTKNIYDDLGRLIEKRYSKNDTFLANEIFVYDSFHLKSYQDKQGFITTYTYDGAGRKIEENRSGRITEFSYNTLGQLIQETHLNGKNTLCIQHDPDFLGQIKQTRKLDTSGKILYKIAYTYDPDGNRNSITHYPHNQPAVTTSSYDPFGRLTETKNPLGHCSTIRYDESTTNTIGQRILTKTLTDPNSIRTILIYDAFGREASKTISTLRTEERFYDPAGNLLSVRENGRLTQYTYNPLNLAETLTRAAKTIDARTTSYSYTPSGLLQTKQTPNGTTLHFSYDPFKYLETIRSADATLSHRFRYSPNGYLLEANDSLHHISRTHDPFGNTLTEITDGYIITKTYDAFNRPLTLILPDGNNSIRYTYDPLSLRTVERISSEKTLFSHHYDSYDLNGASLSETLPYNLGTIAYTYNPNRLLRSLQSPYFSQTFTYDPAGRIEKISEEGTFSYDDLSQLTTEPSHIYAYDDRYNRTSKDGEILSHNALDELVSSRYDLNSNLAEKNDFLLTYDPLNRLTQAKSPTTLTTYTYDPLGRRLTKTCTDESERYLYNGDNELCSLDANGILKDLRIAGKGPTPVAVELQNHLFLTLSDHRGNIRHLLDPTTRSIAQSHHYTAFGEETTSTTQPFNPWRYSSKRFDPDLQLIYFGQRYYDPSSARWLTPDPADFIDGLNLYQYVHNNPLQYFDPNGECVFLIPLFFWGTELCIVSWSAVGTAVAIGAATGTVAYAGYKVVQALNESSYHTTASKNIEIYVPDRPLPKDEEGVPIPETDAPHTELGRKGSKTRPGETYPQAREFDKEGKPVRDIDFTDHQRPDIHPAPHQHRHEPNKTGGTPERKPAEPVPEWEY